ncbi:MAG: hypothetical protein VKK42_29850 [Lyngbya sp.]|nr:hypothetical protein [Lyngbya sp.]
MVLSYSATPSEIAENICGHPRQGTSRVLWCFSQLKFNVRLFSLKAGKVRAEKR